MNANVPALLKTKEVDSLVEIIQTEIDLGKERAFVAVENEKKVTYWKIGQHIKDHMLSYSTGADYGDSLFSQLSNELGIGKTVLYLSVRFNEEYPELVRAPAQLTWTHLTLLLKVEDKVLREKYQKLVLAKGLSSRELKALIRKEKGLLTSSRSRKPLTDKRGRPFIYTFKKVDGILAIDLGFHFLRKIPNNSKPDIVINEVNEQSVVQVIKIPTSYKFKLLKSEEHRRYVYKAIVIEIIDGDTMWVEIDLGFENWTKQKIRFRGINTKEIISERGKTAKQYIESQLKGCKFIAVQTFWRDKFTRYLADVYYDKNELDVEQLALHGAFLNQELLQEELAVRY